jgi:hypothetical protein
MLLPDVGSTGFDVLVDVVDVDVVDVVADVDSSGGAPVVGAVLVVSGVDPVVEVPPLLPDGS